MWIVIGLIVLALASGLLALDRSLTKVGSTIVRGRAYGLPTDEAQRAIELLLRLEGLVLDPVYTGKAMAGLIDAVRSGEFDPADPLIFMHTGGAGGLFGYQDIIEPEAFQSTSLADTIS